MKSLSMALVGIPNILTQTTKETREHAIPSGYPLCTAHNCLLCAGDDSAECIDTRADRLRPPHSD